MITHIVVGRKVDCRECASTGYVSVPTPDGTGSYHRVCSVCQGAPIRQELVPLEELKRALAALDEPIRVGGLGPSTRPGYERNLAETFVLLRPDGRPMPGPRWRASESCGAIRKANGTATGFCVLLKGHDGVKHRSWTEDQDGGGWIDQHEGGDLG